MANRFISTGFHKSPFVRGLEGALKSLYSFIICDCDNTGIWNLDLEAATLYTGFNINMLEFEKNFVETDKAIPLGAGRYFFPDFIDHQYPNGLHENNPAHKNIIKSLKKFDLLNNDLTIRSRGALKELYSPFYSPIGNVYGNGLGSGNGLGNPYAPIVEIKNWNIRPGEEQMDLALDPDKAEAVRTLFYFTTKHSLTNDEIESLWKVFKTQHFTGENPYHTPKKAYSHFLNWSKTQKVNGRKIDSGVGKTSPGDTF